MFITLFITYFLSLDPVTVIRIPRVRLHHLYRECSVDCLPNLKPNSLFMIPEISKCNTPGFKIQDISKYSLLSNQGTDDVVDN